MPYMKPYTRQNILASRTHLYPAAATGPQLHIVSNSSSTLGRHVDVLRVAAVWTERSAWRPYPESKLDFFSACIQNWTRSTFGYNVKKLYISPGACRKLSVSPSTCRTFYMLFSTPTASPRQKSTASCTTNSNSYYSKSHNLFYDKSTANRSNGVGHLTNLALGRVAWRVTTADFQLSLRSSSATTEPQRRERRVTTRGRICRRAEFACRLAGSSVVMVTVPPSTDLDGSGENATAKNVARQAGVKKRASPMPTPAVCSTDCSNADE